MMKNSAGAYKMGKIPAYALLSARLVPAICAWALSIVAAGVADAQPQHSPISMTCTNPYSGVSWMIKVDYDQRTVDSNLAKIDDATISWRDATNGWYYVLDRKSGQLTVTIASATGGNFLHDQCKLDH
ncbi:MAG TPA: hypothetical protein VMF12_18470 [Xanthobacteraceae bacterium]|nr:hypothetical protein [Xanthobacteraceae bacterium]